jgi:ribosomal protein L13
MAYQTGSATDLIDLITKLKAYPGDDHPHDAQKPQALTLA